MKLWTARVSRYGGKQTVKVHVIRAETRKHARARIRNETDAADHFGRPIYVSPYKQGNGKIAAAWGGLNESGES